MESLEQRRGTFALRGEGRTQSNKSPERSGTSTAAPVGIAPKAIIGYTAATFLFIACLNRLHFVLFKSLNVTAVTYAPQLGVALFAGQSESSTLKHELAIPTNNSRLVLMTAVFGASPLPAYFPMFLRSIQASGADGIVIGGDEMELKDTLPPNIRHIPMTWNGLHDLISHKLFGGTPLPGFQAANGYKVIDVKPLYGFLFREFIQEYEFWAHIDNDMIFGNVAKFVNPLMDQFDVISAIGRGQADCGLKNPCKITYGPFTAYRNVPNITELFRLIEADLYEILNTTESLCIDEWGHTNPLKNRTSTYHRSMSQVIRKNRKSLPIRVSSGKSSPFGWDGREKCKNVSVYEEQACVCIWTAASDGHFSLLSEDGREVMFCHFQRSKRNAAKLLSEMPKSNQEAILHATSVKCSMKNGIQHYSVQSPAQQITLR